MKKICSKVKIFLMILLVLFSFFSKPKVANADVGVLGGGMYLASLNPAVLPFALIGLAACLLIGYTISNWDDITAFGVKVVDELVKMGYSAADVVSGTSVKVNGIFKKAVSNAVKNTGDTLELYQSYQGGLTINTGKVSERTKRMLVLYSGERSIVLGTEKPYTGGLGIGGDFTIGKDYLMPKITVEIEVEPTTSSLRLGQNSKIIKDSSGKTIGVSNSFEKTGKSSSLFELYLEYSGSDTVFVKSISVPELGLVSEAKRKLSTEKLKKGAIDSSSVDEYIGTAFPTDETITFDGNADVTSATLVNLPTISGKTYTGEQIKKLDDIRAQSDAKSGQLEETGTGVNSGTVSGTGFWDKLWNWLKRLLDAILGLPASILAGLKALWDWLAKILDGILAIPGVIAKAIVDIISGIKATIQEVFNWAFGIDQIWLQGKLKGINVAFNTKFPNLKRLNFRITEKDSFSDVRMNLVGHELVVLKGSVVNTYASKIKLVLRAITYISLAWFYLRRFYKVSED